MFFQTFEDAPAKKLEIHVFTCESWTGDIQETEEMKPKWFSVDEVPFDEMWADDRVWFPFMIKGCCFTGTCHFATDKAGAMISHTFHEISRPELDRLVKEGYHPQ